MILPAGNSIRVFGHRSVINILSFWPEITPVSHPCTGYPLSNCWISHRIPGRIPNPRTGWLTITGSMWDQIFAPNLTPRCSFFPLNRPWADYQVDGFSVISGKYLKPHTTLERPVYKRSPFLVRNAGLYTYRFDCTGNFSTQTLIERKRVNI